MTCVLCGEVIASKEELAEIDEDGEPICVACDEEGAEEDEAEEEDDDNDDYEEEAGDDEE